MVVRLLRSSKWQSVCVDFAELLSYKLDKGQCRRLAQCRTCAEMFFSASWSYVCTSCLAWCPAHWSPRLAPAPPHTHVSRRVLQTLSLPKPLYRCVCP